MTRRQFRTYWALIILIGLAVVAFGAVLADMPQ